MAGAKTLTVGPPAGLKVPIGVVLKLKSFSLSTLTHKPSMPNVHVADAAEPSTGGQRPLEAAADGPAGVVLGIGETACARRPAPGQRRNRREARSVPNQSDRSFRNAPGTKAPRAPNGTNATASLLPESTHWMSVSAPTTKEPNLPVVADLAAADEAAVAVAREEQRAGHSPAEDDGLFVAVTPAPAGVHTGIEAGPGEDRTP